MEMVIDSFLKKLENYIVVQDISEKHYRDNPMYNHPSIIEKTIKYSIKKKEQLNV